MNRHDFPRDIVDQCSRGFAFPAGLNWIQDVGDISPPLKIMIPLRMVNNMLDNGKRGQQNEIS